MKSMINWTNNNNNRNAHSDTKELWSNFNNKID